VNDIVVHNSSFDTYLAPFIRYDNLDYKSVKQALQEFMFNMNIPTRVGFQSLCWDEPIIIKERGKVKVVEIGRLVDREFEKHPYRVIEQHPQSYALENHDDYQVLSFNPDGKAVWARVKAFVRHRVPRNSEFVRIRTNRGEARVSKAHSLFSFLRFNGEFNPVPKSAEDVKIADDYRHLNEENHFIALRSLENQGRKEEIDLVEIMDELPHLQKNVFVKINPTHTLKRIREKVILEEQSLIPFYKEFGLKDRGVWESWLVRKSIRYDIWRKYGDLNQKVEFKLKNSNIWYPRFLNGKLLENFVKLCAWYISEGHTAISTPLYISQSSSENARDINRLLKTLNALGQVARNRGYSSKGRNTKTVLKIAGKGLLAEIVSRTCGYLSSNKIIPWFIFDLSPKYQRIFIKTLLKGDGVEYPKHWDYSTTSRKLSAGLSLLLSQNGFRFAVYTEKASKNNENWRDQFIIRIFKEDSKPKKTYFVNDFEARVCLGVEKFNYDREYEYDISVDLPQENFVGGAGLLVFHNTPFSNVTLDLKVPSFMRDEPVIIGGEVLDTTYGEFQEEMNIFNRALAEVMLEGDAVGRVFTFPIPTINITRDFEWNDETTRTVLETSAKYGIPYFANFINSDMNPEDVRSMCLHPEEEILIKNSGSVMRKNIGEVVKDYAGEFDEEGWAIPRKEFMVLSLNPETWKTEWVKVKRFLRVVDNKMVNIVTEDGKEIKVSKNHVIPVVTPIGIVNRLAEHVKPGDILISLRSASHNLSNTYEKIGKLVLDEKLAGLLGFFTADGNYLFESRKSSKFYGLPRGLQFTFRGNNFRLKNKIKRLIKRVLACPIKEKKDPRYNTHYLYVYSSDIAQTFYDAGFRKYGRLPQVIFNSPPTVIKSFLKYFFLGDGYEKNREIHINDSELSRDLTILFSMIGIPVCYKKKKNSQRIYIQHKKSKTNLLGILATPTLHERIPGWMAKSTYLVPGLNKKRMVGIETLSKYEAHTEESRKFLNGDLMFIRVKKCRLVSLRRNQEFFDIELEKNHLFVHSLGNITHNCCHLRLDKRELKKRGGGLFGANPLTGSIGVVTINMPRIGFLSKGEGEFFARRDRMMVLAKDVLEIKRKLLEKFTAAGLYPYSRFYLRHIKEAFGQYWKNHFGTIGLIGMNEACLNFLGCSIGDPEGLSFTIKVLDYMRKRLQDFQEETGNIYNLEATPAEGTSHRLARIDKKTYPGIIVANEEEVKKGAAPYYTNSTHLPVYYTDDLWEYLRHQDPLQTKYTGGTVAHVWLGESNPPVESVASLVRKICENFKLPYFTLTPTFSICPEDGYLSGEQSTCPKCGRTTEVYSRVVGYLRPVEQWNQGKQEEFKQRRVFDKALAKKLSVSIASDA